MSYCVNCGVELDSSAEKCVLCNTVVINPNKPNEKREKDTPFARELHIVPEGIKQKFVAYVISIVMLIPNIVCLITNFAFFPGKLWSLDVLATSLLAWVVFVFPFFTKKHKPYLMWAFDTAALMLYFLFLFTMSGNGYGIYLKVILPVIGLLSLQMLVYMLWAIGKKRHIILKTLHIFVDFAIFSLVSGIVVSLGFKVYFAAITGTIIFVSCLCIIGFLAYCYKSKSMRRYLSKRFFT